MRLLEAIIQANHQALAGDSKAGLHPAEYAQSLPLVALTCIDPRLNRFFPGVLGIPEDQFIWLRNAGNIITSPLSSTMRSLALGCAVKHGREIVVIGHSDCRIRKTSVSELIDKFKAIGIDRAALPDNLTDFFGVFASEQQNVIRAVDHIRSSPLIGPAIPVHGLMANIDTGRLDWVVNGYETLDRATAKTPGFKLPKLGEAIEEAADWGAMKLGEMKFPETRIGEVVSEVKRVATEARHVVAEAREVAQSARNILRPVPMPQEPKPAEPPTIPIPPPIRPAVRASKTGKWGLRD